MGYQLKQNHPRLSHIVNGKWQNDTDITTNNIRYKHGVYARRLFTQRALFMHKCEPLNSTEYYSLYDSYLLLFLGAVFLPHLFLLFLMFVSPPFFFGPPFETRPKISRLSQLNDITGYRDGSVATAGESRDWDNHRSSRWAKLDISPLPPLLMTCCLRLTALLHLSNSRQFPTQWLISVMVCKHDVMEDMERVKVACDLPHKRENVYRASLARLQSTPMYLRPLFFLLQLHWSE